MDSKFLQSRSIVYCMVCNYYSLQGKFCDQHQVEFSSLTMFDTALAKDKFTTAKVTKMVTTAAAKERTNFEISQEFVMMERLRPTYLCSIEMTSIDAANMLWY